MIQSYKDLDVYKESYRLMLDINEITTKLPKEENFEIRSQMRRASRGIPPKIAEGYSKRHYIAEFKKKLIECLGESNEMEVHLETAKDLNLLNKNSCLLLIERYQILGKKLSRLAEKWVKY